MKLFLLGQTHLVDQYGTSCHLPTKKVFLLLSILAMNPGAAVGRSQLVEAIWPNSNPESGRTSLRNALAALKKALPTNSLDIAEDKISLRKDVVRCDANEESNPSDLYQGDFMPTFSEDWVLDHRLRIRKEAVMSRLSEAKRLEELGEDAQALDFVESANLIDPLDQQAARLRVTILHRLGKGPEAAKSANTFQARVLRELGVLVSVENPSVISESNPLTVTCDWLVERNPEEAASFLVGTRASWMAMSGNIALSFHQKVLDAYQNKTPTRTLVEAQTLYLKWIVGEFEASQVETQVAFTNAISNNELQAATILGVALSFGFLSQGRFRDSIRHCNLVRQIAERIGDPIELVRANRHLSIIEQHLGREGVWQERVRSSNATVEDYGAPDEVAQQNLTMAVVLIHEGKLDQGAIHLAHAKRFFEASNGRRMVGYCMLAYAMLHEATGDYAEAIKTLDEIRELGINVIGHSLAAACDDGSARLLSRLGQFDFSAESVARATLLRKRFGSTPSIYEVNQLSPTRQLLIEQLSEKDLRAAFARAKQSTEPLISQK